MPCNFLHPGALHKSLRGGSADAALYYAVRMLTAGEEPRYVTRRLIRFASEDVGLADPLALSQAVAADQAVHAIGMPEAGVVIAQCVCLPGTGVGRTRRREEGTRSPPL